MPSWSLGRRFLADEHIDVVETGASQAVLSDVDVVLYDTFAQVQGTGIDLEDFVRDSGAKVVVYSWNVKPELIAQAIEGGARGYLSKVLTGPGSWPRSSASIPLGLPEDRGGASLAGVRWGVTNGFEPDTLRTIDPSLVLRRRP